MTASIVPSKHPLRHVLCAAEPQDALHVPGLQFVRFCIVRPVLTSHPAEEASWRELLTVPHYDDLLGTGDGPERVHRLHLACLVDQQEVKFDATRFKILSHRNGAHHEDWLDGLDGSPRLSE